MNKFYSLIFAIFMSIASAFSQWVITNPMNSKRSDHVSVVLENGNVLVAGGYDSQHYKTSEIFDVSVESWTTTQNETTSGHSATTLTLLNNGNAILVGGWTGNENTKTCELYNPNSDSWSLASSLMKERSSHTATLLQNGKVLVVGGFDGIYNLTSCEIYDPANDTWTAAASLGTGRSSHTATLLNDGRVFVTGGYNPLAGFQVNSTEIYNPETNTWSSGPNMLHGRNRHSASILSDGKVMVTGGESFTSETPFAFSGLENVEIYNPTNNTFSFGMFLPTGICFNQQFTIGNYVIVIGGKEKTDYLNGNFTSLPGKTYLFNQTNNVWSEMPMNFDGRIYFSAVKTNDNRIIVTGGEMDVVEIYDFSLSIPLIEETKNVLVYPNPSDNFIYIDNDIDFKHTSFQIFSIDGKLMANDRFNLVGNKIEFDLPDGIYFLQMNDEKGLKYNSKFTVKN
jgi:N-acetylneuraminic acid mutarotase